MNAIVAFPTPAEKTLAEQFRASRGTVGDPLREQAFATFAAAGLPHRRIEAWHYTDLRGMLRDVLPQAAAPDSAAIDEAKAFLATGGDQEACRIVLLDGHFVPGLSQTTALRDHVEIHSTLESLRDGRLTPRLRAAEKLGNVESVVSLNGAFLQGGAFLHFEPGTRIEAPIEIVSILSGKTPSAIYTRSYVDLGEHACATIVERHAVLSGARTQGHHVLVLALGDGSSLDHVAKVDSLGDDTLHVASVLANLGADAKLLSITLLATGGVTRRQSYLEFAGPSSQAHFRGVSLLDGRCHTDTTLVVTHTAPRCESRELYKHVLDGEATGVYQGKVIVSPGAQKTDGKMLSKAVFLTEGASMYNKPELEIFADDVVCGHGATAGSLDEDQLFYLRARGIPLKEAQAMLLEAFADEAIEDVANEALRTEFAERIGQWLRRHGT